MTAPDPILQFFLTIFYKHAIDPTSDYYLPKLIQSQTDPVVEPYTFGGDWNNVQIGAEEAARGAMQICQGTASGANFGIPTDGATPLLDLVRASETDFSGAFPFELVGLSNMLAAAPVVTDGDSFTASATLGSIVTWPIGPIHIRGNFIVNQSCCLTDDMATCIPGSQYAPRGEGTFDATIATARASVQASATVSPDGSTLTVTVNSLGFTAQPADLSVDIVIMSVQDPVWRTTWSKFAEEVFSAAGTRQAMIAQIGETLNSDSVKQGFQNVINNALASMFGGGALQEHLRRYQDSVTS